MTVQRARRFEIGDVVRIADHSRLAANNPAARGAAVRVLEVDLAAHYADHTARRFDYLVIAETGQAYACNDSDLMALLTH